MQRVTDRPDANEQLLYFTSSSLTDDGRLVFLSDRTGDPNVFARNLNTGEETQLTDNRGGVQFSYVYFGGTPHAGLAKASVSLDHRRGQLYYVQDDRIWRAEVNGERHVLATLPARQVTAFTHVSSDGRRLCVPTIDARAFGDDYRIPDGGVDHYVRQHHLASRLRVYDTQTGEQVDRVDVPGGWVTHVQFHPTDPARILYNHEWADEAGLRRMWLWDGQGHRRLRPMTEGRDRRDWVCHEVWADNGRAVIYHGQYREGPAFLGRLEIETARAMELRLPDDWRGYGHFVTGPDDRIVSDGYYRQTDEPADKFGRWITVVDADWTDRVLRWMPLVRHGSGWADQDAHPHPVFDHAGRFVYFTSDHEGRRAVYRVAASASASASVKTRG